MRTPRRTAWQPGSTFIAIVAIDFFLFRLAPGDAADVLAAESGSATEETMTALRHHFGLDQPWLMQFLTYIENLLHFSLGFSPLHNMPVSRLFGERLPGSLLLMTTALVPALVVGITAGVVMSMFAGSLTDRVPPIIAPMFYSIPGFWIGLMLIEIFSITTVAGMHVGAILGGAVVVETVFSWPGLGRLAFEAVCARPEATFGT
jgi:peptide/nickel transport system permease protein